MKTGIETTYWTSITHVSLGIVYDKYYFAYVQNFENIYINFDKPIDESRGNVKMSGTAIQGQPYEIGVFYDEYPTSEVYQRDKDNHSVSFGDEVAYIVEPAPHGYDYPQPLNYTLIEADTWHLDDESFDIEFNLYSIMKHRGAGVYTLVAYLEDQDGEIIPATTYSIFK